MTLRDTVMQSWSQSWSWTGAAIGLVAGLGLLLLFARLPWRRRPELADRMAPYVRDVVPPSALLTAARHQPGPLVAVERFFGPVLADAVTWLERTLGAGSSVRGRLDRLGRNGSVEQFRSEQLVWAVAGALAGAAAAVLLVATRGGSAVPAVGLVLIAGLLGLLGRDRLLSVAVRRREDRILAELPTVADLVALSVGAGEGTAAALERVARTCSGELAVELRRVLADVRTGTPLTEALDRLGARTGLVQLTRFVDGIVIALQRGTPLAEVVRAQAQDVREMSRRRLIESGARKEVTMMVPVVFLVLPVTVLFVVYPGLAVLDLTL
jgi:tight adherence protein C